MVKESEGMGPTLADDSQQQERASYERVGRESRRGHVDSHLLVQQSRSRSTNPRPTARSDAFCFGQHAMCWSTGRWTGRSHAIGSSRRAQVRWPMAVLEEQCQTQVDDVTARLVQMGCRTHAAHAAARAAYAYCTRFTLPRCAATLSQQASIEHGLYT